MNRRRSSSLVACAGLVLATPALFAQQIGSNSSQSDNGTYKLSVTSQLVVETVVAKDKQGHFIGGLTAKDFTITEDGVAQKIRFCEHETLPTDAEALPPLKDEDENITIYKRLTRTSIAQEDTQRDTGKSRYQGRRLIVLYFDMTTMRPEDQLRAINAAETFLRKQMTAVDLISIMRYQGGSVDVLQDFSADRNRLLSILQTMLVGEGQGSQDSIDDSSSADTGAAFGQDDSEFNVFNNDRQLSALQTAAQMLASMNEKKSLIYFASGLRLHGIDNQAQLHATVDAAIRAGVTFWPVDARGLVANAPLGDATQGSPGGEAMYTGASAQAVTDNFQQSQDTLYSLAADTGGKALLDNNDLTRGITQVQRAVTDYYVLGYYTSNTAQNGHFRKIKLTLNNDASASLDYRQGYYANKEFAHFNEADKERQLEDALMLGDPITELTVSMEINYFQLNRAEYYVPLVVKIPGRELALAKKMGSEHTVIDFVCEIKDDFGGTTVSNIRDSVNIKLSDQTAAQLAHQPIEYDAGVTLLPGHYTIKFLARDDETGRIGTFQTSFYIPNLNKVTTQIPISSVVLSSQRLSTTDALYNTVRGKQAAKNDASDPLVQDGQKIIPSVTRVFKADKDLYVFLQAYAAPSGQAAPAATPPQKEPLVGYVSLYSEGQLVFTSKSLAVTPLMTTRLGVTPFMFTLPLGTLKAATYECQVTLLDAEQHRVAFWQGPLRVVQ
ncbi:MAG TPA: VWA domain-containing protein [Verrucomicrobiae bacterium]|jgi:VWFA-related protein|nr:VWA domain-containing protein [Verrucomicrobiae bacterium]